MKPIDFKYPDTGPGAIEALGDISSLSLEGATAKADPDAIGVWLVEAPSGARAIVYLFGYGSPYGLASRYNDFEEVD